MALRHQNNSHTTDRVPGYYAFNRLYKDSYARTDWPTRTSRRIHDGLTIDKNYGLDTVSDDVNSSPYSSPYYVNGRYNSSNLVTQRGNSASVQGIVRMASLYDQTNDFTKDDIQTYIELWQGKQIKFTIPYSEKVVGNTLTLRNTGGCTGILSIYFSTKENGLPIYETAIDLCQVSTDIFEHLSVYSANVLPRAIGASGKIYVRMEIWDEISLEKSSNPFNTGRKIEIAATGLDNHYACEYKLGDKNVPAKEEYNYERFPSRPLIGLITNAYESIPTNRSENDKMGASVSYNGYQYDIFCIKKEGQAEVIVYDKMMNKFVRREEGDEKNLPLDIKVDGRIEELNLVQALEYVYYVDGHSELQKFKIGEWVSQIVTVTGDPDPEVAPVLGPSIICKHNNRIYLSGFTYDKNLVIFSEITGAGSNYDSYPYRFYVPSTSVLETSTNNVVQILEYGNDTLCIIGTHFASLFTSNRTARSSLSTVEDGAIPTQQSLWSDGIGIQASGDIVNYKGTLYSFDQNEGIRRFNGTLWNKIPEALDSHIERVDMEKPRKLWGYANKLYFNYTDKIDGKRKCVIWDMDMNYQMYPWFQDIDTPFCDIRFDKDFDLTGIHPDYPCVMKLYAQDVWRRFDTPIVFERHTKYLSLPGNSADMILKRVHNKVLANSNRWWWFSLSYDKHTLEQRRGRDVWYRVPCWDTINEVEAVETPFPVEDEYETDAVAVLTLSNLRIRAVSVQEKVKCKTFRSQASLISTVFEAAPRQYD